MGKYLFHGSFTAEGLRGVQKKGGTWLWVIDEYEIAQESVDPAKHR